MFFLVPPIIFVVLALIWYLRHVERGLQAFPLEAEKLAPKRWSETEIKETYARLERDPIDFTPYLPKKLERRYVVVGGSGLVGGFIIQHLLARGQDPKTIRNVDFRVSARSDMRNGKAKDVEFVQADITDDKSIKAAFDQPWATRQVEKLPLTVFHTAAVIRPGDRGTSAYSLVSNVNVFGCANTLAAAKSAGASVFIATSSGSVAIRPLKMWIKPWESCPPNMVQIYPDPDKDRNIRDPTEYFGNYAVSKARAEELVLNANTAKFRTGCIRPACGVYGLAEKKVVDLTLGTYIRAGTVPS
jgi:nucleoside-diphosphate-sugar epimerase